MYQNRVADIRQYFIDALANEEFVIDKTGVKTVELVGASFIADEPAIFGTPNKDYIDRELEWYKSQSLNVNDIPGGTPSIWKQVASEDGMINSNYGWVIWSDNNYNQYEHVVSELRRNPNSRRAVMIYTRPIMWHVFDIGGRSDFICTNAVQYLIRDGKLDVVVQMRSNDVVFGFRNDYAWQKYVQELVANELQVEVGTMTWQVASLHIYERHFDLVK